MSWIDKILPRNAITEKKVEIPKGVWSKCNSCDQVLYFADLEKNLSVCPNCNHHMRVNARRRIEFFLDENNQVEIEAALESKDLLKFKDSKRYKDRLVASQKSTEEKDALVVFCGSVLEVPVVVAAFEFGFMGGSMGSVVGAKFVAAVNKAIECRCGLVCFSASGGARMQEALFSLMQMAKTSAALAKLSQHKLPFISVLTDPTMGGVSASLAMLGDINIAEPKAMVGFAGQRVILQTVRETLPEGFQSSEFLLAHGAIDLIIDRREMRQRIGAILAKLTHRASPLVVSVQRLPNELIAPAIDDDFINESQEQTEASLVNESQILHDVASLRKVPQYTDEAIENEIDVSSLEANDLEMNYSSHLTEEKEVNATSEKKDIK